MTEEVRVIGRREVIAAPMGGAAAVSLGGKALKSAANPTDAASIRDAVRSVKYRSVARPIDLQTRSFPNATQTRLALGESRQGTKYPLALEVADSVAAPDIPI